MGCPVCGRMMCDCSPAERGQSTSEMMSQYYAEGGVDYETGKKKEGGKGRRRRRKDGKNNNRG